jgi:hypothetical protein
VRAAFAITLLALATGALAQSKPIAPPEHVRRVEQTYLTFPEWFLVFSPDEYAAFTKEHPPSEFPFWGHIRAFWQSYGAVTAATQRRGDELNVQYHVMVMVNGTSTTAEYAIRSAYETIVGRIAELTRRSGPTQEDLLAARVAQEYVDFIRDEPWYKFDFTARLKQLWSTTDLVGPDILRKWERKYALTSEYLVKAAYGWLLGKATAAGYEKPLMVTAVVLDTVPQAVTFLPRYHRFTAASQETADGGGNFREIAGNGADADILVSVLVPSGWGSQGVEAQVLFRQPIITRPGTDRVALVMPVGSLAANLRALATQGTAIEHVFDY